MAEQVYFEDVRVGQEVVSYVHGPVTLREFVRWAGAADDYSEIHYDSDFVKKYGFPAPLMAGPQKSAIMARLLTDWIGARGQLRHLRCQYRAPDPVGETLKFKARIADKHSSSEGDHLVELEVQIENSQAQRSLIGSATVRLPSCQKE